MAKKTKDGLIVKGFKNLANRFSPEAEKYARYKIQKQKGTYKDPSAGKLPTEAKYRGATAAEKKSMAESLSTKKSAPQKTATQKKREKSNTLAKPKVSGRKKLVEVTSDTSGLKKQKGSEAPKKQISKKDRRRNLRAAGLATRKGISLEDAKKLQEKRRDNRKQFLRNFAANLAGVEQNTVRGQINTQDMSDAYKGKPDATKAQESETAENEKSYKNRLFFNPEPNKGLGEVGIDLTGAGIIGRYDKT